MNKVATVPTVDQSGSTGNSDAHDDRLNCCHSESSLIQQKDRRT